MSLVSFCAAGCAFFLIYEMTKSIKGVMIRLMPGQTEGVAVCPGCTSVRSACGGGEQMTSVWKEVVVMVGEGEGGGRDDPG